MLERIRFRRWWQAPRAASEHPEERRITFLELFYDLVYVVIISELSHTLAQQITLPGIGTIPLLIVLIALLLTPVIFGILTWIKVLDARELEI